MFANDILPLLRRGLEQVGIDRTHIYFAKKVKRNTALVIIFMVNGVSTKNGNLVGRSFVSDLLSNPIYYGHFRYAGEVYEGNHEPIISKELFDRVQAVFNRRWRYSPSARQPQQKPYLGLLCCGEPTPATNGLGQLAQTTGGKEEAIGTASAVSYTTGYTSWMAGRGPTTGRK